LLHLLIYRTVRYQKSTTTVMSITRMRRIPQYKTQEEDYFYFAKGRRHGKRKLITICWTNKSKISTAKIKKCCHEL
jgi:hypothetical protein